MFAWDVLCALSYHSVVLWKDVLVFLSVESTFYSLKYPFLILQLAAFSSSICHMTFGQFCYKNKPFTFPPQLLHQLRSYLANL